MNCELPDVQSGLRKGRGTRDQIVNICWIIEKAREFQKNIYFWFIKYGLTKNCEKFLKKHIQLELDMEQQTGSKLGKEYIKAVYCHPAYLTSEYIMQNARLDESQAEIKFAGRNINNFRYEECKEELKHLLMKEESEKPHLKLNIQNSKIIAIGPITSWQIEGENVEAVTDFIFLGSRITVDSDWDVKSEDDCFSAGKPWQT